MDELSELQGKTGLGKASSGGGLLIGDTVEVIEGDLVGMRGKLVSLDGTTVKVKPTNNTVDLGGTQEVEFLANQVRKYIAVGDHVKVTDGRYANETGVVVAVEKLEGETDCTAVVLTDVTHKEITGEPLIAFASRIWWPSFGFSSFLLCLHSAHFSAPRVDGGGIWTGQVWLDTSCTISSCSVVEDRPTKLASLFALVAKTLLSLTTTVLCARCAQKSFEESETPVQRAIAGRRASESNQCRRLGQRAGGSSQGKDCNNQAD